MSDRPASQRARSRKWYEANRDKARAASRVHYEQNTQKMKDNARKKQLQRYGITPEIYASMLNAQGGVCAICHKPPRKGSLHVDHCHDTGVVRGLLCFHCNAGIGHFEENLSAMASAMQYLNQWRKT